MIRINLSDNLLGINYFNRNKSKLKPPNQSNGRITTKFNINNHKYII